MGLRTTNRTLSLSTKENFSKKEFLSNSLSLSSLIQPKVCLHSDAVFSGKMAPALTEPLSPTNKLSSSAASASPRPTAASSPLQNNNNNNNTHTANNNSSNESIESVENNSSPQSQSGIQNNINSEKDNKESSTQVIVPSTTTTPSLSKGAFQLAFEQSVGVRKATPVANGEALSPNCSQMGPMCDSKSSHSPLITANSSPLIKSKISQIDPETAAKIITSQFEDFPSDIEEAITAEICLRQKLKSTGEEVPNKVEKEEKKEGESSFQEPEKLMDQSIDVPLVETKEKPNLIAESQDNIQKNVDKPNANQKTKVNIISVQELPPVKTDSTVTASEEDNIEERLKQLDSTDDCQMPISQEVAIPATPPQTPSAQILSQLTPTTNMAIAASISSLTPQSTTSTICGGSGSGNQKDFKDNTSEMDHDIEEDLLQVLKGFDTAASNDICDLAGFLSDYAMNYEDVNPSNVKENPIKEVQVEIEKNQQSMQRKIDFLSRRLRKLQARYMCKQASEEISGLFEWSARTTKRKLSSSDQQMTYAEEKYHPVTTTTMRNVLKRIETVATDVQHVSPAKKHQQQSNHIEQMETVVPTFDDKVTEEIAHVSGLLQAEMREVQSAIDSDATASSSGGESADETVPYNNQFQEPLAISKRAAWRYSRDRAAIASRWSWLLSQISDLEYKIRQHTDLHQQLRQRKGRVVMLNPSEASELAQVSGVNGYRGALPGESGKQSGFTNADDTDIDAAIDAAEESSQGACRTRAFQNTFYRKRKLFQTANVHTISKKAARPSTIKCGCQWPLHPCALCTGRSDPTAPRDLPDTMTMSQRVALLDPGYHPVLSFRENISNSIFFESISRNSEWQSRVVKSTAKAVIKGAIAAQRAAEREERGTYATSGRISPSTLANANAGKRKYTKKSHQDTHGGGSHSTTPLVANKVGKNSKKHHRNRSPDYIPRKNHTIINNNSSHYQTLPSPQSYHRNVEQSNHHLAHSSSIYQHLKNNKTRKLSSASITATTTAAAASTNNLNLNKNLNPNYQQFNNQQSYNNELNFLHCDSLDGDTSTNGLAGLTGRSRTSSPTHGSGYYKYERSLERKSRTSYDIDNIVIPYSVAAATRVELLPYKEIPTPKWRIVESDVEDGETKSDRTEENSCSKQSDPKKFNIETGEGAKIPIENEPHKECDNEEDEDEDISDEAMMLRHERALIEERRKFKTFLKFPWSTRSRANRRIDSRAESSGANTPDPTSPAPNTPSLGGDQESIPSPFAPSTPLNPLDNIAETGESGNLSNPGSLDTTPSIMSLLNSISKKQERRRTVSSKKDKDDQRRSSTPDSRELIPPYEPLTFPIPNDLYENMLRMMPDAYPAPQEDCPKSISTTSICTNATPTTTQTPATRVNGLANTNNIDALKLVCDQKFNNKNTFQPQDNNQKSINHHHHITGEDDDNEDYVTGPVNGGTMDNEDLMKAPHPSTTTISGVEFASFSCRNNLIGCSDTESMDSENGDDDPNDPEWKEEEGNK